MKHISELCLMCRCESRQPLPGYVSVCVCVSVRVAATAPRRAAGDVILPEELRVRWTQKWVLFGKCYCGTFQSGGPAKV